MASGRMQNDYKQTNKRALQCNILSLLYIDISQLRQRILDHQLNYSSVGFVRVQWWIRFIHGWPG